MLITIEGLITKEIKIGENNKLVAILTKNQGIIYAFINNNKKTNNNLLIASEISSYGQFVIFKYKEKYTINEAHIINKFPNIRKDIEKLSLCCYLLQLANELIKEEQTTEEYLRLLLNSLYLLDSNKKELDIIKAVTELKMITIAGYMPNLLYCSRCLSGDDNKQYFFLMSGEIRCKDCNIDSKIKSISLSKGVLYAMRYIIYSDISKIYSFKLNIKDKVILSQITEEYLLFKTDLDLSTLKYFNNIIKNNVNI